MSRPGAFPPARDRGELELFTQFPGDGCDPACRVEPGFLCSGEPSLCTPIPIP